VGAPLDRVAEEVRAVLADEGPDVVVTLDPTGGDGHRDHVRIAEATTIAFDEVASAGASLYYWCLVRSVMRRWVALRQGSVHGEVTGSELGCPDEMITTEVDAAALVPLRRRAIRLHRSQPSPYDDVPDGLAAAFLSTDRLVRARPPWTRGPVERHLPR
jgi:N-acetyl-1-D-myo-inositol-2-amino-2-deoxy-alpha-D-glucopyranoside deacetylase